MLDSLDTLIAFVLIMLVVSLLITIAVQITAALLNLRGVNLLNGLASTFAVIDPDIEKNRKDLARFVLRSRLLSDSCLPSWKVLRWWRLAAAMRPDEIFDAIKRIAMGKEPVDHVTLREDARKLLIALGVHEEAINEAAEKIGAAQQSTGQLTATANAVLESLPESARTEVKNELKQVTDRLNASEKAVAAQVLSAAKAIDAARQRFEYWTEISQERAQQWFTMHTRVATVFFAIIAALALQLDTVEIFKLVSSNRAVRDKLVAQAGTVEAQAARLLGDSNSILKEALKDWGAKQTDPAITSLLLGIEVKDTDTRELLRDKVATILGGKEPIDTFDAMVNATAIKRVREQAGNFNTIKADFEKTGFDLFPKDNLFRWGKHWSDGWNGHRWGILFSAGLLSLGAPFWYNGLKNLTSLRSTVAQNISQEQDQAQKQSAKPNPPPPTVISS